MLVNHNFFFNLDALKTIGKVSPKLLYDKVASVKDRFRNYRMCDEIMKFLEEC